MSSLYGFSEADLDKVKGLVEQVTGRKLRPHHSLYRGGDYYRLEEGGVELVLMANYDCLDEDLAEMEYPESKVLAYLSDGELANEIALQLSGRDLGARLLRQR
jgi:hypothetical protein